MEFHVSRILVRVPNHLGDIVMALPALTHLRQHYAGSNITIIVPEAYAEVVPEDLYNERIFLEEAAKTLGSVRPDLAVSFPASVSSALLLRKSRAPHRVGYAELAAFPLYTQALSWPGRKAGKHKSELYTELIEWLCGRKFDHVFHSQKTPERKKLIIVAPGASVGMREWPYFEGLLRELRRRYPAYRICLLGTDSKFSSLLMRWGIAGVEDLIGRTSLSQVVKLCEAAALVVCNDSGIAHVSATLAQAPTLVLFGPGDPGYVLPNGITAAACRAEALPCMPCESPTCHAAFGQTQCLKNLSLDSVVALADKQLGGFLNAER